MRQILLFILILTGYHLHSQQLDIHTLDNTQVRVTILGEAKKQQLRTQLHGKQDDSSRKQWTARTFTLSNGSILLEFYDRQAVLIHDLDDFKKLDRIRFVKNTIDFLKKNISYKIELSNEEARHILQTQHPKRLNNLKSDMPEYYDFEVYELGTGQILFLDKSGEKSAIYENLKTLSSDNNTVQEQVYNSQDEDYLMKRLAAGDALPDYELNDHFIHPKYLKDLIKNHHLTLIQRQVYVSHFFGNLYRSSKGYYILIDEENQENGAGSKMPILDLRIYQSLQEVRDAQKNYAKYKDQGVRSEHFYQKISDRYGEKFPDFVPRLIDSLPLLLNFDKVQLSFDSAGTDLVDEAFKWNGDNYKLFDSIFPSILAYYGQSYIINKKDGEWKMFFDKEYSVWIPEVRLKDGTAAWDWIDFYKELSEGPIPLRSAGDWDGKVKKSLSDMRSDSDRTEPDLLKYAAQIIYLAEMIIQMCQ